MDCPDALERTVNLKRKTEIAVFKYRLHYYLELRQYGETLFVTNTLVIYLTRAIKIEEAVFLHL